MSSVFEETKSFNGGISKWDVSSVTNMNGMFCGETSFNGDLSNWDVSRVDNMDYWYMLHDATSFKRTLCGAAWVHSNG